MFTRSFKIAAVLAVLCAYMAPFCQAESPYYQMETKKGWWWYEKTPEPEEKEEKPGKFTKDLPGAKKYPRDVTLDKITVDDLWKMHPDDFQELYDMVQKKAVQYPDDEKTMREYYVMTDMYRRKALAFANATQAFLMKNPEYNMNSTIPLASPGKVAVTRMQASEKTQVIKNGQEDHALIYFSRPGCQFCSAQEPILKRFLDVHGWTSKRVDVSENPAAAEVFGVETVPMIILVKKGNSEHVTVAVGVATAHEIEEKVYRGMKILDGADPSSFSTYEYQKQGGQDVKAPLKNRKGRKN